MRAALLALLVAALVVPGTQAAWSSFHGDERNTGFQSGTDYQVYEDVWWSLKVDPATQMEASPVVSGTTVVVAGWDKTVRALDAQSGTVKWTAVMASKIVSTPAISNNRVFVVDSAGTLNSHDLEKGTVLGTTTVGATLAQLAIHEGKVFIGNEAGEMKAYDTETLTLLWKFSISSLSESITSTTSGTPPVTTSTCGAKIPTGQIRGAPAIYRSKVIFGSLNHWVFAVDEQGEPGQTTLAQWIFKTEDAVFSSPMVDHANSRILIGSYDEKVYALPAAPAGEGPLNVGTGSSATPCTAYRNIPTWTFTVPSTVGLSKVHSTPATDGTRAYFGANNGYVFAIKLADGAKVWDFKTGGESVISSPAVSNGLVVVGADDGKVYWLNATDGAQRKTFIADSRITSNPAIDGARAFVTSSEGSVYMLGPKIPTRPDLQVASVVYNGAAVVVTISNAGDGAAGASTLRLTIDGALAADLPVPPIEPGQSTTVAHTVALAVGPHPLIAKADQAGVVEESDENNNELTGDGTVAPPATSGSKKGGNGIPGPGLPLALLALAFVALRRRRVA